MDDVIVCTIYIRGLFKVPNVHLNLEVSRLQCFLRCYNQALGCGTRSTAIQSYTAQVKN